MGWICLIDFLIFDVSYNYYSKLDKMQQKLLLINSMEKLINHIVVSKKNQQEIFASLSKNDFKKIISNLDDENQRLRKISLALISQLLHNNNILKQKFCHIMNIPLCPGRIALNTKLCAASNRSKNNIAVDMNKNIKEVFNLLKQSISEHEKQSLFWFINYDNKNQGSLQLQYLSTTQPQTININDLLDPIDSMIGFILPERITTKKIESFIPSNIIEPRRKSQYQVQNTNSGKLVNNYFKPNVYKPDYTKQYPPANINQSLNLNPGYSTDRQTNYIPKTGIIPANRAVNASMYQEQNNFNKTNQITSSPMNQMKPNTFDIQNYNRSKYTGIKLISNPNTVKSKQTSKYFQQQPIYVNPTNNGKSISFNNPNNPPPNGLNANNSATKNINMSMKERGYQTLREKKIIEKYP